MGNTGTGEGGGRVPGLPRNLPMHRPSERRIRRIRDFYLREYGREITEDEARELLGQAVHFVAVVARGWQEHEMRRAAEEGQQT